MTRHRAHGARRSPELLRRDSGSMASSHSASLVLRRSRGGPLELTLAVQSDEIGGGRTCAYITDVEGPDWLADFIVNPPARVAERLDSMDAAELLANVAQVSQAGR